MLIIYDNDTFIVESILPEKVEVDIDTDITFTGLRDMQSGELIVDAEEILDWQRRSTGKNRFKTTIKPHSYRVFRLVTGD